MVVGEPRAVLSDNPGWQTVVQDGLPTADMLPFAGQVVVVGEDWLRQRGQWDVLPALVRDVRQRATPVILLYDGLTVDDLVRLQRAGLFDALGTDAGANHWGEVLQRAAVYLDQEATGHILHTDAAQTQRLLKDSQRRVRNEVADEASSLLEAQAELERANARLGDHMAQVSLLYRFGRQLSLASNWDDTLRDILQHLAEFVGAAGGALVLRTAPGGPYAARQTYRWDESAWDKVLLRITRQIDAAVASSLFAPGVFQVGHDADGESERITALALEHEGVRLGMLLLLFADRDQRRAQTDVYLPFLQMVQVVLSEEVAAAQMLDRMRDVGDFNARVLETVSSAIWVCDAEGQTIFVNRAARGLLGFDERVSTDADLKKPAVGRGRMLVRPLTGGAAIDDLPALFEGVLALDGRSGPLFKPLIIRPEPFVGEGVVTDIHGHRVPVRVRTSRMVGRRGDETWLLVVLEDLSETRRAEAARRRADQLQSLVAMSATLAHEIRNPLMGLSAQAELLADSLPADDVRRRRIDLITGEVERIDRTITDMLQFVRPCQPRREPVEPETIAAACLELAGPRAAARGIDLALIADRPHTLQADPAQLQQVLLNLVFNAIDAAPDSGRARVRIVEHNRIVLTDPVLGCARHLAGIEFSIEDDGPGFGGVDPEKLFRPFFTTKTTGTGLGLAYSRKVIEAHNGEIRAERDGAWTCMRVVLPRETSASSVLAGEAS